jgi:shikimate dehydrogenase
MTTGNAKLAGVIGWPVAQSLSPRLHAYWLRELGIDGAYVPLAVRREDFALVIDALHRAGFAGINVTVPHKEAAFALAHETDEMARAAGAANLLLFRPDGSIEARNTDMFGLVQSLNDELDVKTFRGGPAVILGAGGAARAAVLALDRLGAGEIRIVSRNPDRAEALASMLKDRVAAPSRCFAWNEWAQAAGHAALLVNATSAGMRGGPPLDITVEDLPAGASVCDLVYNPLETELLKQARARGLKATSGLGMLMHQAVSAFEAFYGARPAVTPELRAELEKAPA